jgi:hypothetical protein
MKPLIASLLATLSLSACVVTPPTPPQSLTLSTAQQSNLRTLLGLTPSSAFTVNVLDQNNDRVLSPGDLAIMYGGIANTETSRRTLSVADITRINADTGLSETARQLQTAEAKWQRSKPEHYAYTLQRSCFCAPDALKPIEIRVFQGKVQQATVLPDGTPLPADRQYSALTIDDLFKKIHDAIDRKAARLSVTYDAQYGFPTNMNVDYNLMMADEELSLSASNFKLASGLKPTQPPVMCTMEAKICPNGGAVGRVAPHCEFAPCPDK